MTIREERSKSTEKVEPLDRGRRDSDVDNHNNQHNRSELQQQQPLPPQKPQ
ncbi:hypothetical protein M433DRAFT_10549 [Acidomyces richmondensis BFW]|nr:hypothetical protein M433DRAFT_10549 [Acidomyces richmondensis BFW]